MCRSNFTWAVVQNLDESLCKTLAVWAALQLAQESFSDEESIALHLTTLYLTDRTANTLTTATGIAMRESVSSGVRSAILAQSVDNYRLHTFHTLTELAKVIGQHFVDNTLADILETNEAPRVA
jgi:hypothetical protein